MQCVKCCVGHAVWVMQCVKCCVGHAVWVMQCVKCCVGLAVWGNAVWVMQYGDMLCWSCSV